MLASLVHVLHICTVFFSLEDLYKSVSVTTNSVRERLLRAMWAKTVAPKLHCPKKSFGELTLFVVIETGFNLFKKLF